MQSTSFFLALCLAASAAAQATPSDARDPRIREVNYHPNAVISVEVKRGVSTHIQLEPGESIAHVASGLGADCAKPELPWCVDAKPGQPHIFVKAKSSAAGSNTLAVVTDRRSYSFQLVLLPDTSARPPLLRLVVRSEPPKPVDPAQSIALQRQLEALQALAARQAALQAVEAHSLKVRLQLAPDIVNSSYSIATGRASEEIAPTLVFDDGRFTYLRFPGNREIPAVFQVAEDGSESMVNARIEDDLLVADRVTRQLVLRKGNAVVAVYNDAYDIDGRPPEDGTTMPGVQRLLKVQTATEQELP